MTRWTWQAAGVAMVAGAMLLRSAQAEEPPKKDVPGAAPPAKYTVEEKEEVQYGEGGGEKLYLTLARPTNASGKRPCIVYIHGGGWAAGHRKLHAPQARQAAERGYVSVTVSYRFAPKHPFPAQVEDCKCAIRWLRAHADELQLDQDRIGAVGFSAGAHLSMMLGTMDKDDGLEGTGGWPDQSSKVQAVVAFFGPTDLTREYPPTSKEIVRKFMGGTKDEKLAEYKRASPITYVTPGDAPMLLFQGTKDSLVPTEQATLMADALSSAKVPGRVELLIGADHGWAGKEIGRTFDATTAFFDDKLGSR